MEHSVHFGVYQQTVSKIFFIILGCKEDFKPENETCMVDGTDNGKYVDTVQTVDVVFFNRAPLPALVPLCTYLHDEMIINLRGIALFLSFDNCQS